MTKSKRKRGRPSDYSPEIATKLCKAIATSSNGLAVICAKNPDFPSRTTIYKWIADIPEFANSYAHARQFQSQAIFDEILEIADRVRVGVVTKVNSRGKKERRTADMVERSRLMVDARKWCLSKLLPKKYGDAVVVDDGREDPLSAIVSEMHEMSRRIGPPESMEETKSDSDPESMVQ